MYHNERLDGGAAKVSAESGTVVLATCAVMLVPLCPSGGAVEIILLRVMMSTHKHYFQMFHAMNNFKRERNDTINEIIVKLFF